MTDLPSFALSGHIAYTPTKDNMVAVNNGLLVCESGKAAGVFSTLPERFAGLPVRDCGDCLIIPGLCDLHVHAPQYCFRGLGMDEELIEWLDLYTYPAEKMFAEMDFATRAYTQFADALKHSATTRAAIFGTMHIPATLLLMEMLESSGLCCFVGKVNMDRNAPMGLCDPDVPQTLAQTEEWIKQAQSGFTRVRPILTPRFIPSCTDALLEGLGDLQKKYKLPVQSHLSENKSEIAWVKKLCPGSSCYADAYARHGLFGGGVPTVMAHCVHPSELEFDMLRDRDVIIAHCPASNANLCSGIAPVSRYLDAGVRVGLGTDIAGGFELSILRAMSDAVQFSKLRASLGDMQERHISLAEAFYMGTKGGGALFGKVGSFEEGYEFDALVLDDHAITSPIEQSVQYRVERAICLEKDVVLKYKYVQGREILQG